MKRIALSLIFVLAYSVANAAEICDQRAEILKRYVYKHGEKLLTQGKAGSKTIYENYVNQGTGSFTWLRTTKFGEREDGTILGYSCVIGSGVFHEFKGQVNPTKHTSLNIPFYALQ